MTTTKKDTDGVLLGLGCLGLTVLLPVAIAYSVVLYGFAFMKLWAWFVAPAFGLKFLSLPMACGLETFTTLCGGRKGDVDEDDDTTTATKLVLLFVRPAVFAGALLLIGYVIKSVWL